MKIFLLYCMLSILFYFLVSLIYTTSYDNLVKNGWHPNLEMPIKDVLLDMLVSAIPLVGQSINYVMLREILIAKKHTKEELNGVIHLKILFVEIKFISSDTPDFL